MLNQQNVNNFNQNDMTAEQGRNILCLWRTISVINLDDCCSLPRRKSGKLQEIVARSAEAQALIRRSQQLSLITCYAQQPLWERTRRHIESKRERRLNNSITLEGNLISLTSFATLLRDTPHV
jgi:hypothetical protein